MEKNKNISNHEERPLTGEQHAMDRPLVSVSLITYNHASWIAQSIESVLAQKAEFRFEVVIAEDCSTDGTREIVFDYQRRYPDVVRVATSEQNVGLPANFLRAYQACRGKYIAILSGDDYWIDLYKLQKQVDFLESNPDYGMVHSDYDQLINRTGKIIRSIHRQNNVKIAAGNFFEELLVNNFIGACTVCARANLVTQAITNNRENWGNWMMEDRPLWMEISRHSKIGYIDESLAVYRKLEESASWSKDTKKRFDFVKSSYAIRFHFIEKYGCSEKTKNIVLRDYHRMILRWSFLLLDGKNARNSFEFLQTVENDRKEKVKNYCHYFGSRNRLNWLIIRTLMQTKSLLPRILRPCHKR